MTIRGWIFARTYDRPMAKTEDAGLVATGRARDRRDGGLPQWV